MDAQKNESLEEAIRHLINCYSVENESDTPDFILAEYLMACLKAFNDATVTRTGWYKRPTPIKEAEL